MNILASLLPIALLAPGAALAQDCAAPASARTLTTNDISSLSRARPTAVPTRGEFETSEQFEARRAAASSVDGLTAGDAVSVEMPIGERMTYDPDRRRLSLTNLGIDYSGLMPIQIGDQTFNGGALEALEVGRSTYASTNGFGAQVTVSRQDVDLVTFAWPRGAIRVRDLRMNNLSKTRHIENFEVERAQRLQESGKVRVIGTLVNPVIARISTIGLTPTFQRPIERRNWFSVVAMRPTAVCIIDGDGTTVLDQWQIEAGRG